MNVSTALLPCSKKKSKLLNLIILPLNHSALNHSALKNIETLIYTNLIYFLIVLPQNRTAIII